MRRNVDWTVALAVLTGFGLAVVPVEARSVIFVDDDAPAGGDGGSWETAFASLQDALAAAAVGREVWVAAGRYRPDDGAEQDTGDRFATFQLTSGVALSGGLAGDEDVAAFDLNDRDFAANATVLTGDLAGNDGIVFANNGENSYHIVTGSGTDATAVLDGFTISGGNANSLAFPFSTGGGMFNDSGSPTLANCTFSANAAGTGGGMYNLTSSPTLADCTFNNNAASHNGGGMLNNNSSPRFTNCAFVGNAAAADGGGLVNGFSFPTLAHCRFSGNTAGNEGGGMKNHNSSPTLANCTFSENTADGFGGGMSNGNGNPVLTFCTFSGNMAPCGGGMSNAVSNPNLAHCTFRENTGDDDGGGMYNRMLSSPTLANCVFSRNTSSLGGGMYNYDSSSPILTFCRFSGNTGGDFGGGMYNGLSSSPTLTNCTFGVNMADDGGGMHNGSTSSPILTQCSFSGNMADDNGGGMRNFNSGSSPTLTNCIFWGNVDAGGSDESAQMHGGSPAVTYSCIQGLDALNVGNITDDPFFVRSPNAGPDETWGTEDDDYGDWRLTADSPVIDAGDPGVTLEPGMTDLDGHARVLCGRVDMGAYEFGIGDFNCDSSVNLDDYASWAACVTGVGGGPYVDGCEAFDFDFDLDVDFADFAGFQNVLDE